VILWDNKIWGVIFFPLALIFRCGVMIRMKMYDLGLLTSIRLPVKVISVGNITVGGTGKTPLVEKLAQILRDEGHRVGVLSRGWGRQKRGVVVVSDGENIKKTPEEAGDEPYLLAKNLQGIPVLIGKNRGKAGELAVQKYNCEILILDDGFQHLRIQRDFDFVVIDATNPWGNGRLIPAGPLRESVSSLKRANSICFTRVDQNGNVNKQRHVIGKYSNAPVLTSIHQPVGWVSFDDHHVVPLEDLQNKSVLAFAGIGNPNAFLKTLEMMNVNPIEFIKYRDHYWYSEKDLIQIRQTAVRMGAEAIVTTEKDAVRLSVIHGMTVPFYYLKIKLEFQCGVGEIKSILKPVVMSKL